MRVSVFIVILISVMQSNAQQDSAASHKFALGGGLHLTQAMFSTPAVAGQLKLKYGAVELAAKYGRNKVNVKNIRGFDELTIAGDWAEVGFNVIMPYQTQGVYLEGLKLGVGFGSANTEAEYREIFESLPPFQDLVYTENYTNNGQKYLSFTMGYQFYPASHFETGLGIVGFYLLNDTNVPLPASLTPFMARSPVGLYLELSYVL